MFTRGTALALLAVGSLVLFGMALGLWVTDRIGLGWVMFGVGAVGWLVFFMAVVNDTWRNRK